jgi:hypothetical protein
MFKDEHKKFFVLLRALHAFVVPPGHPAFAPLSAFA